MSHLPVVKTKEEQAQTLANYLPGGRAFNAKNISDTTMRKLLRGLADELSRTDTIIALFRTALIPDTTEHFIEEWESAVGIPDECFNEPDPSVLTDVERRLRITIKLSCLNLQTQGDFVKLAEKFGVTIEAEAGSVHGAFPFKFPMKFYATAKEAMHTIVIRFTSLPNVFTYTFPIEFSDPTTLLLQCLFNKAKPAHVNIAYENL